MTVERAKEILLEEECERLKNELLTYGVTGICETCTEKSVSENDKLKSTIRCLEKDLSTADCIAETLKAQYKELKAENEKLKIYRSITPLKVKMLVKTLAEIKEIADTDKCYNCKNINEECFECANDRLNKILQKISECEVK